MSLELDMRVSEIRGEESMKTLLFVSYSTKDESVVRVLIDDLEKARQTIWFEQDLRGGQTWWAEILDKIRECRVFVFVLSNNSLASKPCLAELKYARDLGLPILPVQVGSVSNLRTTPISDIQIIDYRERSAESGIALVSAIFDSSARRRDLPSPLPEPPPVPFGYLLRLRSTIEAAEVSPSAQTDLLGQLRECLQTETEESVLEDARGLLRLLRQRSDITFRNVSEIDSLLTSGVHRSADDASPVAMATNPAGDTNLASSTKPKPSPASDTILQQGTGAERSGNAEQRRSGSQPPPRSTRISGLAIASLVCSILFGFGAIPAIICGHLARKKIRQDSSLSGANVALAGLIIGYIMLAIVVVQIMGWTGR